MKIFRVLLPLLLLGLATGSVCAQKPVGLNSRLEIPSPEITIGGPAVEPAFSFPATFVLSNGSSSPVKVEFADPSLVPVMIAFRLLDASGEVLWTSEELLVDDNASTATLAPGRSWKRTVQIPLFIDDSQLEIGQYVVEAYVLGTPDYSSAASFQMTSGIVPTPRLLPSVLGNRKWGVFNTLSVEDSRVIVGLRNGSNVRLSGVVRATFSLANETFTPISCFFSNAGSSQRKIAFSLLDAEGDLLWRSDTDPIFFCKTLGKSGRNVSWKPVGDPITLPVMMESILPAGKTWSRDIAIPLYKDGSALPDGFYTIVGEVDGTPTYRSATTIRVINRAK